MELSTIASFAAAVISLVTLVVTTYFAGRRERVKWAREALAEAFYDFVDASYAASNAVHRHQKQLWLDGDSDERYSDEGYSAEAGETAADVRAQEIALRRAQTKIRLLAPAKTARLADEVRFRVRDAMQAAGPTVGAEQHESNRARIAEARAALIAGAKRDMALPR